MQRDSCERPHSHLQKKDIYKYKIYSKLEITAA
jgi:hypothetical protein